MPQTRTRTQHAIRIEPRADSIKAIRYRGLLIGDTSIPGEGKRDGVIPAHPGGGALRLSRDRWIVFFATLDTRGWDSNRSIIYQLRGDRPDGRVITEGLLAGCREDWDPLQRGEKLFKSCGMPIGFGVPKGAVQNGREMVNANVFVVKWYRWAHKPAGELLLHPSHHRNTWPEGLKIRNQTCRVEWAQFRLNDTEDDIELLCGPTVMRERGYEDGAAFCRLGPKVFMNHSMRAPSASSADCREWVECDTFVSYEESTQIEHGSVAAVRFLYDRASGRYEWAETGALSRIPDRTIGESSVIRWGQEWLIACRSFAPDGATCWYRTDDPFAGLSDATVVAHHHTPRMAFRCADGVVRLFGNDQPDGGDPYERNPLCCWDVNVEDFAQEGRRVLADAGTDGLRFAHPMLDMPKLCPHQEDRQLVLFRAITRPHTALHPGDLDPTGAELAQAGIHYAEIIYQEAQPEAWCFTA